MALYRLETKHITRGKTRSSTAAAAYQSATCLKDTRTNQSFSYESKKGVLHTEIITPDGSKIGRSDLWNLAEISEKRKDSRTAREYILALPHELTTEKRIELAQEFAAYLVEKHGIAADLAIHAPSKHGDQRNFHAHILTTTRIYKNGELGPKIDFELGDKDRKKKGLGKAADELTEIREKFEMLTNKFLQEAKTGKTVSAKSLKSRGIKRQPQLHLGPRLAALERKGIRTRKGDYNRAIRKTNEIEIEKSQISQELDSIQEAISKLETEIQTDLAKESLRQMFAPQATQKPDTPNQIQQSLESARYRKLYFAHYHRIARNVDLKNIPAARLDLYIAARLKETGHSAHEIRSALYYIRRSSHQDRKARKYATIITKNVMQTKFRLSNIASILDTIEPTPPPPKDQMMQYQHTESHAELKARQTEQKPQPQEKRHGHPQRMGR